MILLDEAPTRHLTNFPQKNHEIVKTFGPWVRGSFPTVLPLKDIEKQKVFQ